LFGDTAHLHLRARAATGSDIEVVAGEPDQPCPVVARGADQISFVDTDDTMKATYGYAKQGACYGYNGVRGLNALLGTVTTPMV